MDEKIVNEIGFTPADEPDFIEEDDEIIELIDAITADEDELEEADVSLKDMLLNKELLLIYIKDKKQLKNTFRW